MIIIYKLTTFKICSILYLLGIIIYTFWNYNTLSSGEGWGIVAMFGLAIQVLWLVFIDLFLCLFFKDLKLINIIESTLLLIFTIILIIKYLK